MRERVAQILKIVCLGLAVLLLVQLVKVALRANPLANATIPDVPSLPADTNAPSAVTNKGLAKLGTNNPSSVATSNAAAMAMTNATDTNAVAHRKAKPTDSNAAPVVVAGEPVGTNATTLQTNMELAASTETNTALPTKKKPAGSNPAPAALAAELPVTNSWPTNPVVLADTNASIKTSTDTNSPLAKVVGGTNGSIVESGKTNSTNSAMAKASAARRPPSPSAQIMNAAMLGGPGGAKAAKLPPEIQARVDRIVESEILAPINHPMPMALLGIAGKSALLRSPSGQTGLVKEGDALGEIKLLRIGINRVLVEQDGQPKELMIFSGLGGESLLPKPTVTSDETIKH